MHETGNGKTVVLPSPQLWERAGLCPSDASNTYICLQNKK